MNRFPLREELQELGEIGWKLRLEAAPFTVARMVEAQHRGVEGGTSDRERLSFGAPVDLISDDRKSRRRQMYPDLVGSAGLGSHLEQDGATRGKTPPDGPGGPGRARGSGRHRHPLAVPAMATDRQLDSPRILSRRSARQSEVDALDTVVLELLGQSEMGLIVFRRDQYPGSSAIQTVDDAGSKHAADSGEISAVVKQRIHQGPARMAGARVHHQPSRLVDHDHVLVFVEHVERNLLGHRRGGNRRRRPGMENVAEGHALAGTCRTIVQVDEPIVDPAARSGTRDPRNGGESSVQALVGVRFADHEAHHIRERMRPLRKTSTSTRAQIEGVALGRDIGIDPPLEERAGLVELRAQAIEEIVRLDPGAHALGVVQHHVGEDGASQSPGPLRISDSRHRSPARPGHQRHLRWLRRGALLGATSSRFM